MSSTTMEQAHKLYEYYRKQRDGIRKNEAMATICIICGSVHVVAKEDEEGKWYCRNCGVAFYRYACPACGKTVDGRDPQNPYCHECGMRICTCGACHCPQESHKAQEESR